VVINELPLEGPSWTSPKPMVIKTANGPTTLRRCGTWREVGFCYLHNDPTIRPEAHLFSVPSAVKDGLLVSFSPSAKSMIVTHLDGYLTVFKLLDGLYLTTLNRMHRPKSFFSTDTEVNDHSVSIMTRSMSRAAPASVTDNHVAENVGANARKIMQTIISEFNLTGEFSHAAHSGIALHESPK